MTIKGFNYMNIHFVIVSKDASFKMMNDVFDLGKDLANITIDYVASNDKPLAVVYNEKLRIIRQTNDMDYVIFMHSDVSFNVPSFIQHLISVNGKYGLIGLCGTSTFNVSQSPLNWWTSSNPTPFDKWGCVTHGELGNQTSFFSNHSPTVTDHEVSCIDGLCIIFTKTALETSMEFDESLSKFDFYDSDISMQAVMKYKLKVGVIVRQDLCHYSVGKSILTDSFLEAELKFRQKWNFPIPPDSAIARYISSKQV